MNVKRGDLQFSIFMKKLFFSGRGQPAGRTPLIWSLKDTGQQGGGGGGRLERDRENPIYNLAILNLPLSVQSIVSSLKLAFGFLLLRRKSCHKTFPLINVRKSFYQFGSNSLWIVEGWGTQSLLNDKIINSLSLINDVTCRDVFLCRFLLSLVNTSVARASELNAI